MPCLKPLCPFNYARLYRIGGPEPSCGEESVRWWNQSCGMPTISTFYGILIRMFFNDHPPPHFHARYGEFEATVEIGTLEVLEGQLPRRALNLVREWAMMHRGELLEDWRFCRENTVPTKIEPLA